MNRKIFSHGKLALLILLVACSVWRRDDLAAERVKVHNPSFNISVVSPGENGGPEPGRFHRRLFVPLKASWRVVDGVIFEFSVAEPQNKFLSL